MNQIEKIYPPLFWFSITWKLLKIISRSSVFLSIENISEILNISKLKSDLYFQRQEIELYHSEPINDQEIQILIYLLLLTNHMLERDHLLPLKKIEKERLSKYNQNLEEEILDQVKFIIADIFG